MTSFLMDEDSSDGALLNAMQRAGLDVTTVNSEGRRGLADEDHLSYAAQSGRTIVTANARDFAALHVRWME